MDNGWKSICIYTRMYDFTPASLFFLSFSSLLQYVYVPTSMINYIVLSIRNTSWQSSRMVVLARCPQTEWKNRQVTRERQTESGLRYFFLISAFFLLLYKWCMNSCCTRLYSPVQWCVTSSSSRTETR
jgi:hypothetical protein